VVGDIAARAVYQDQPAKFAAMEVTWRTRSQNPEILGGIMTGDGTVRFGLSIPWLDSVLANFSPGTVVRGLSTFPAADRPGVLDANFVHLAFDVMVGLGSVACLLTLWYTLAWVRSRDLPRSDWFFRLAALAGIGSYIAIECGWITTEVGRQPWIVYHLMRVSEAVNPIDPLFVWSMFAGLLVVYAVIAFFFVTLLLSLSARWRLQDEGGPTSAGRPEADAPYGPPQGGDQRPAGAP
jgi:cytochrome d ubiquinol oxidase subunit I